MCRCPAGPAPRRAPARAAAPFTFEEGAEGAPVLFEDSFMAPMAARRAVPSEAFRSSSGFLSVIALATIDATRPRSAMTLPDSSGWLRFVRRTTNVSVGGVEPHRGPRPARVPDGAEREEVAAVRGEVRLDVPAEAAQVRVAVEAGPHHRGDGRRREDAAASLQHRGAEPRDVVGRREKAGVPRDAAERVRARVVDGAAADLAVDSLGRGDAGERKRRKKKRISEKVKRERERERAAGSPFPSFREGGRRAVARIRRAEDR